MKLLPASAGGSSAVLRAVHAPDNFNDATAGNWTVAYGTVLSVVNTTGGWFEVAQIYKRWVLQNAAWTRAGTLQTRVASGDLPQWVLDVPFWVRANMDCGQDSSSPPKHMPQCNVVNAGLCCAKLMITFQKLLSAGGPPVPLGMHWYGWNAENFDTRYPVYTARGGITAQVTYAQNHGIHVMPVRQRAFSLFFIVISLPFPCLKDARCLQYTNGRLFDPTLLAWKAENASAHACGCFQPDLMTTPPKTKVGMAGLVPCDASGAPGYYGEKYGNNVSDDTFSICVW
jgi:hypothetical protein